MVTDANPSRLSGAQGWVLATVALIVVSAGFAVVARGMGIEPVKIVSNSMAPTITNGDWIVVIDIDPKPGSSEVRRGDIVTFRFPPQHPTGVAIKRAVAIGGDIVTITSDHVAVNGIAIPNSAAPDVAEWARNRTIAIPDGYVFLLGDNARESIDSRAFGPLPEDSIRATHLLTLAPARTILTTAAGITALVLIVLLAPGAARLRRRPRSRPELCTVSSRTVR